MKIEQAKKELKQEEKEEVLDEKTSSKCHPISKPRIIPAEEKKKIMRGIKQKVRKEAIKEVAKQRPQKSELKRVRVEFEPSELLQTGLFVHRTSEYMQLSLKPLFSGPERLAINLYPCPAQTCELEVQLIGAARVGLVTNNTYKRVPLTQSITLNTEQRRLRIGAQSEGVAARMNAGTRVRLMVCVATRKFRVYVDQKKQVTADFPMEFAGAEKFYFYVQLLGSEGVRILK